MSKTERIFPHANSASAPKMFSFVYFLPALTEIIYNYTILSATIDCCGCGVGAHMYGSEMIVEMSENIGQLKIETYEKIVRLTMTASDVIQCFTNNIMIKMRYQV